MKPTRSAKQSKVPVTQAIAQSPRKSYRRMHGGGPPDSPPSVACHFPVVGELTAFDADGHPVVLIPTLAVGRLLPARTTVPLAIEDLTREVLVVFELGDLNRPIVTGVIQPARRPESTVTVQIDQLETRVEASEEISLRCGAASLTLRENGEVVLRGTHVLTHATETNRILGATVRVN